MFEAIGTGAIWLGLFGCGVFVAMPLMIDNDCSFCWQCGCNSEHVLCDTCWNELGKGDA